MSGKKKNQNKGDSGGSGNANGGNNHGGNNNISTNNVNNSVSQPPNSSNVNVNGHGQYGQGHGENNNQGNVQNFHPFNNYQQQTQNAAMNMNTAMNYTHSPQMHAAQGHIIHQPQSMQSMQTHGIHNSTGHSGVHLPLQSQLQSGTITTAQATNIPTGHGEVTIAEMQSKLFDSMQQMNTTFMQRLDSIDNKMAKLEPIEKEISLARFDISTLQKENSELRYKVNDVEDLCVTVSSLFDNHKESSNKTDMNMKHLQKENSDLKEELSTLHTKFSQISEELLDLKTRSMQENLLFFGLGESPRGQDDNTETKLRDFLKSELEISEYRLEDIVFDRVHRVGKIRSGANQNPRPIVAKFEKYTDRELIRKASVKLNEKKIGFSIREQFPKEIEDRRRTLYPVMRKYRQDQSNRVSLVRDKLFINGERYTGPVANLNTRNPVNGVRTENNGPQPKPKYIANRKALKPTDRDVLYNNPFGPLQRTDTFTPDRAQVKRKANSPLSEETDSKKQNESDSPNGFKTYSSELKLNIPPINEDTEEEMDLSQVIHKARVITEQLYSPEKHSQSVLDVPQCAESVKID